MDKEKMLMLCNANYAMKEPRDEKVNTICKTFIWDMFCCTTSHYIVGCVNNAPIALFKTLTYSLVSILFYERMHCAVCAVVNYWYAVGVSASFLLPFYFFQSCLDFQECFLILY